MLSVLARQCAREIKGTLIFVQKRTFLLARKVSERKFKLKDKIPQEYTMIYKAPLEYYLSACNHITTASAFLLVGFSVFSYFNHDKMTSILKPYEPMGGRVLVKDTDFYYFAIASVAINVVLRISAYRFPLRIYKNATKQ